MALRRIGIGGAKSCAYLLQAEAKFFQYGGVEFDPDARECAASYGYLADAGDLRHLLCHHGGGRIVHLTFGKRVGSKSNDQDRRIGRVDLTVTGIAGQVRGQIAARCIYGRFHVAGSGVDVAIEIELNGYAGGSEGT